MVMRYPSALTSLSVSRALRDQLLDDFLRAWTATNDGQVRDLTDRATAVTPAAVLTTYHHKSGSAYAMACVMAARHAGAESDDITRWRQFGSLLGVLAQFRNDQEDLDSDDSDDSDDLRNQTATYRLVQTLASTNTEPQVRALLDSAPACPDTRRALRAAMHEPRCANSFLATVRETTHEASRILKTMNGNQRYLRSLHELVDAHGGRRRHRPVRATPHL